MGYSYVIAKDVLSEGEKNRIVCLHLNCEATNINWEKATTDFGCASTDSMRVSVRNLMKKIEKAGGKFDNEGNVVGEVDEAAVAAAQASGTATAGGIAPKKGGRKRKAAADADADEDGEEKPAKKVKGGKKGAGKKTKVKAGEDEEEDVMESIEATDGDA